ncbi:MAG: flagellar motor protein MotB [Treponema sp.]|nr:flagellar motor protein MotB [Treponema sp.]
MLRGRRAKKDPGGVKQDWIVTYADMISLLLCFFVALFSPEDIDIVRLEAIISAFHNRGQGIGLGGHTLSPGNHSALGNTIAAMPSMEQGRAMGTAMRRAVSLFTPEVRSNLVRITQDERGIIISFASDAFFHPASARINIEETRDALIRAAALLNSNEVGGRRIRLEGHTDAVPVDPAGPWQDNWHLSAERSRMVLRYLADFGVDERRFQISGFADTMPLASNETEQGRALNRRVDIIIIDEAHL